MTELASWTTGHRPDNTDDLVCSDEMRDRIDDRIRLRDEHAFLITGPYGCGKTTIAKMLAHGYSRTPWGTKHPDIHEVNCADKRGIDDIRNLVTISRQLPQTTDGRRVLWLEEVHQLTSTSASPLLRAIEESPKTTMWMLVTNEPHRMLPTLVSRCYSLKVDLADPVELRRLLLRVLRAENKLQDWKSAERVQLADAVVVAAGQIPRTALGLLKNAVDAAPNYQTVAELLASPTVGSPQLDLDKASIKIILALLLRASRGKDLTKPIFTAFGTLDGYGLLNRLLWLSNAAFLEAATEQQQPGSFLFKNQYREVPAFEKVPLKDHAASLGVIVERLADALSRMKDFTVDPKIILTAALIDLHRKLQPTTAA